MGGYIKKADDDILKDNMDLDMKHLFSHLLALWFVMVYTVCRFACVLILGY